MKILSLQDFKISNATAIVRKNKDNNKMYFYIPHGTRAKDLFCYNMAMSYRDFIPNSEHDTLELKDDDYIIAPVIRDNSTLKDRLGNTIYCISKDSNKVHANDIILFWKIPNKKYTNVELKVEGDVDIIATGYAGKLRGDVLYKSPAPVLEIFGDCYCKWTALDMDGKTVGHELRYSYKDNKWNIENIGDN